MKALLANIPEIDALAPKLQPWDGNGGGNNVVHGTKTGAYSIMGDYPDYNKIDPVTMLQGRFINQIDIEEKRKICVIGTKVRSEMFKKDENPLGQYLRIKGVYFQVVGVYEPKNKNMNFGGDKEATINIPFTVMQIAYNFGDVVHFFAVTAKKHIPASVVEDKCIQLISQRNMISPEDGQAIGHFNLEKEFKQMNGLFSGIQGLIWIVGIGTLLAGVIGVSNIMLIIVKERTKEIGIQRALGAGPWRVISQVISESVVLTAMSGIVGLMLGVFTVEGINYALNASGGGGEMFLNPTVDFKISVIALIILILSGIVAGLIPARKAVSVKPIDALRYE
jgi:putative ABC transport system permease protein